MNPILLKALVGIGALGATTAASVGGYYWLSASSPKTIGEKLNGKTPLNPYDENDTKNKEAWKSKKDIYTSNAANVKEDILPSSNVDEQKISDKCKEILAISLSSRDEHLEKKEEWAKNWCFA